MKLLLAAALAAGIAASPALAQEPAAAAEEEAEGPFTLSANIGIYSDYRFRGVSLSDEDVAVQGGIDLGLPAGFYVGAWASNIEEYAGADVEVDLIGGWSGDVGLITLDGGFIYYFYPSGDEVDYWELYGSVGGALGPVEATLGVAYVPEQDSVGGTDNWYLSSDLAYAIGDTPVTLKVHFGYEDGAFGGDDGSKLDWSLGVDYSWKFMTASVAYIDTDQGDFRNVDATVLFSLVATF